MRSGREEQSKNSLKRDKSNKANKKKNKPGYDSSESDTGTASELNESIADAWSWVRILSSCRIL